MHLGDMSNAAGAYRGQAAACHCCVHHTPTCMSMTCPSFHWHACHMPLNTFLLPPTPCLLWGHITSPRPLWWQGAELDGCPAHMVFYQTPAAVSALIMAQHSGFLPPRSLLLLKIHSVSGHAISRCWDRQAGYRDQMRKWFPGQYKKGRERQTVHRKHGRRTRSRSQHGWEHWPC